MKYDEGQTANGDVAASSQAEAPGGAVGPQSPAVWIVVPAYNRAKLLPHALDSILAQSFVGWTLVVVDDRSTDDTWSVVQRYASADPRIIPRQNDTFEHSPAGARLAGLSGRTGEYVAFLDSDDRWAPFHLEVLVGFLEENPDIDVAFGDLERVDASGNVTVKSKFRSATDELPLFPAVRRGEFFLLDAEAQGLLRWAIQQRFNSGLQTSVYRASVFDHLSLRTTRIGEDALLTLEAIAGGHRFAFSPRVHLRYLQHPGNMSGGNPEKKLAHMLDVAAWETALWERLVPAHVALTWKERAAVRKRLADHLVWDVANSLLRANGRRGAALAFVLRGISLRPWSLRYWKTLFGTLLRG